MIDYNEPFQKFITSHDPIVSVVVTSYNKARFLRECVESFVGQSYPHLEVLIVNDGSPDDTSEVARELMAGYPKTEIKLLEKPNGGVSDARNFGLRQARGRVVLTIDGDDKVKPDYLEKAVAGLRSSGGDIFRPCQENFGIKTGHWSPKWEPHDFDPYFLRYDNCFPTPSIFDRALFEKCGGFKVSLSYGEDWEFWLNCCRFTRKVTQSKELLTCFRFSNDGLAAQYVQGKWRESVSVLAITNEDLYCVDEIIDAHRSVPVSAENNILRVAVLDRIHVDQWFSKLFMGLVAENQGNLEEARSLYLRAIELSGGRNWQPLFRLGKLLHGRGVWPEALILLHETRILRPDTAALVNPLIAEMNSKLGGKK